MLRRTVLAALVLTAGLAASSLLTPSRVAAEPQGQPTNWGRFYHYPYVYYPHNYQRPQSYDSLYYRYPQDRRIPVYNKAWHNYYPEKRPYHRGHHFILDVF